MLDLETIAALKELEGPDEPQLVNDLIDLFSRSSRLQMTALQGAIAAVDPKKLDFEAHSLKGSAANLGATKVSELALRLERMGRQGTVEGAAIVFSDLEVELTTALSELETIKQGS